MTTSSEPTPPQDEDRVARCLARLGLPSEVATQWLAGDASARRYVRVAPIDRPPVILLLYPVSSTADAELFLDVGKLFRRIEIPVPTVIEYAADLGIVVLEDLGDITLQQYLAKATTNARRARYVEALTLVDRIQRGGRELEATRATPFRLAFDVAKLLWELEFFVDHFLTAHRSARLSASQRAVLHDEFTTLATELAGEPRVLCHRDFHSRNLMWHDDALHVIDFQDARMGPSTYDLVSLLRDCYVEHDPPFVADMLDVFRELAGPDRTKDLAYRFDVMSVQRHLKALGTFGYQASRGNERYLDDVPRTAGYLRDVFDRHSRFRTLREALAPIVPELS